MFAGLETRPGLLCRTPKVRLPRQTVPGGDRKIVALAVPAQGNYWPFIFSIFAHQHTASGYFADILLREGR